MGRVAFLFPGQGSQSPGMGRALHEADGPGRRALDEIDEALSEALGRTISDACLTGSAEDLALTETTQPAILACSVAAWRELDERGVRPDHVAGHSLGEYSALVAAGVLSAGDAAVTVARRGRFMQEAVPVGEGAMAALLGAPTGDIDELLRSVVRDGEVLEPANHNAPGQVVIAGHRAAVERAIEAAPGRGVRKAVLLPVSAPFHCELMQPAADALRPCLAELEMGSFAMPLVANVTAREVEDPEEERRLLGLQVTAPVRWQESVERLVDLGCDTFVEVGPGRVLSGLVKRMARGARILQVGTPEEAAAAAEALA